MTLAQKLVEIAAAEVGTEEVNGSNRGPRVDQYQAATWLEKKDWGAWCAAFVCWCVREAMKANAGKPYTFERPMTAGAFDFARWSLKQDASTHTKEFPGEDIKAGDIVIFKFSHIGIATGEPVNGAVDTIEGNTDTAGSREGGGVYRKKRALSLIKTRIRFTV